MSTPGYLLQRVKTGFAEQWRKLQQMSGADLGLMSAAYRAESNGKEEDYGWMGSVPTVHEFLSEAQLAQIGEYDFIIRNKDWETSVSIKKSNYEDDKTRSAENIGRMLALKLAKKPAGLIEDLLIAGDVNLAYDGIAFFSDVSAPRVNDNLLSGTGITLAQLSADLESVESAMMAFKDDQGEYLNIVPNLIVCGPKLVRPFQRLVGSESDVTASATGTYNPFKSQYQVIGSAKVGADDTYDWYAMCADGIQKPFVVQNRKNPKVEIEDRPTVPTYGIVGTSRGNVGYGLPQLAVKVVNT